MSRLLMLVGCALLASVPHGFAAQAGVFRLGVVNQTAAHRLIAA